MKANLRDHARDAVEVCVTLALFFVIAKLVQDKVLAMALWSLGLGYVQDFFDAEDFKLAQAARRVGLVAAGAATYYAFNYLTGPK